MHGLFGNNTTQPYALGIVTQQSTYGATIPTIYGKCRAALYLIWQNNLVKVSASGKALKSKKSSSGTYTQNCDFLIGQNPIVSPLQWWENNNQLIGLNYFVHTANYTPGSTATVVVPDVNAYVLIGMTLVPAVPQTLTVNDYGSQGSEVLTDDGLWQASYSYTVMTRVQDTNNHIQVVTVGGTSGSSHPVWNNAGGTTTDNGVTWQDMGAISPSLGDISPQNFGMPLWNSAYSGPDRVNISGWRWYPYTYRWVPISLFNTGSAGIDIDQNALGNWPAGVLNIYYAQITLDTHGNQIFPMGELRLTFEPQLGFGGSEYDDFGSEQVIYPSYAGVGSPNIDMGVSQMIPSIVPEVLGALPFYGTGDCDFADMIEDTFKGVGQSVPGNGTGDTTSSAYSAIHHGIECYEYPGMVQKKLRSSTGVIPAVVADLPVTIGNYVIVVARNDHSGALSISDSLTNSWTPIYPGSPSGYQVWQTLANASGQMVVTVTGGAHGDIQIMEMGGLDSIPDENNYSGTGGPITGSITTTNLQGTPEYILAILIADDASGNVQPAAPPAQWNNLMVGQGRTWSMYRIVYSPGTYTFTVQPSYTGNWKLLLLGFNNSTPVEWQKPLGNIIDQDSLQLVRNQDRAFGLYGSCCMSSQKKALDWVADFCAAGDCAPVWSGDSLKFIPYSEVSDIGSGAIYVAPTASGPQFDLSDSDFVCAEGDSPIQIVRSGLKDRPNVVQIQHPNRASDYNDALIAEPNQASIALYGQKKATPQVISCIQDVAVSKPIIGIALRKNSYLFSTYKFTLNGKYAPLLEPMDLVTITDTTIALSFFPVRLTRCTQNDKYELECEAEPFIYGLYAPKAVAIGEGANPYLPPTLHVPTLITAPIMFEPVAELAGFPTTDELWMIVANTTDRNYGGCAVFGSIDGGVSYTLLATVFGNGSIGVTTADWAAHIDPDGSNDLLVDMLDGELPSYTAAEKDQFGFPYYVSSPSSWSDLACLAGSLNLTSVSGGFSDALNGESITIASGTNMVPGVYPVTFVNPNLVTTLTSPAPSSNGSAGVGSVAASDTWIPYEVMTFETATLTSGSDYTIESNPTDAGIGLRRGVFAAPKSGDGVDHPAGSRFGFIDPTGSGIAKISLQGNWIGLELFFKFCAFNQYGGGQQQLSDVTAYTFTPSGVATTVTPTTDTAGPDAPLIAVVDNQASTTSSKYHMLIGIQTPGTPSNWDSIIGVDLQVTQDQTFTTFVAGQSLNLTAGSLPGINAASPFFAIQQTFDTNFPGTYYIRARLWNSIGAGTWSGTGQIETTSIDVPGTGYSLGDVLDIVQSGATGGTVIVSALGSGGSLAATTQGSEGEGYTTAIGLSTTGGTGTGGTITITAVYPLLSLSTNILDATTVDTGLVPAVTPTIQIQAANTAIPGNGYEVDYSIPATNTATFWGTQIFAHHSATLPTATTFLTGTAGSLQAGNPLMTDLTASFTPSALIGKNVVVFCPQRSGTPSFDYEGMIVSAVITANSATTISFNAKSENLNRTVSGCVYYVVNPGNGFFDKLDYASDWQQDSRTTAPGTIYQTSETRSFPFQSNIVPVWVWVSMNNVFGQGPVTATPATTSYAGISSREVGLGQIIADKLTVNSQGFSSTVQFGASSNTVVTWLSGVVKLANGTSYNIAGGNTGTMSNATYIYLDTSVSITALQVSTTFSVSDTTVLLCYAQNITDATQLAMYIPQVGALGMNSVNIQANSIQTTSLAAGVVTAAKINVASLSAISANIGTVTAGMITGVTIVGATIETATTGSRIALDSTNGFRAFDSFGAVWAQIPVGAGTAASFVQINNISANNLTLQGNSTGAGGNVVLQGDPSLGALLAVNTNQTITMAINTFLAAELSATGFALSQGSFSIATDGLGIKFSGNAEAIIKPSGIHAIQFQVNSTLVFGVDSTNNPTNTNLYIYWNGAVHQVAYNGTSLYLL